ncbi:uncharacterized protein JCM10292_000634 [Rhodotorula paludigena]|uniref:uncharacterized protein n=1 Tax=Rhodotorula paludigena TaxID=86838 RepID=UPI003173A046
MLSVVGLPQSIRRSTSSSSRSDERAVTIRIQHAYIERLEEDIARARAEILHLRLLHLQLSELGRAQYGGPAVGPSSRPYWRVDVPDSAGRQGQQQEEGQQGQEAQQVAEQHEQHRQHPQQLQHSPHPAEAPAPTQQHEPVGLPSASSAPCTTGEMQLAAAGPAQTVQPSEPTHPLARESSTAPALQPQDAPAPARASADASDEAGPESRRSRLRQQLSRIIKGKGKEKEGGG